MRIELNEQIEIDGEDVECVVVFECNGVWTPGVLSGPPEHCYPPEGPEIEFIRATIEAGEFRFSLDRWDPKWMVEMEDKAAEEYAEHIKGES